jgi:hypothetical protein
MKRIIFLLLTILSNAHATTLYIPISYGEFVDKITILQIKSERIQDKQQLEHVHTELQALEKIYATIASSNEIQTLTQKLKTINTQLWDIEDAVRKHEQTKIFDEDFIDLARKIPILNDERYRTKTAINVLCESSFIEQKSHTDCQKKS